MNDLLPPLSPDAIRDEVKKILLQKADRRLFAFYGTGRLETVALDNNDTLEIVPIRSEIDLRAKLPPLDAVAETKAYLVPWEKEIPLDIAGRFARQGRVVSIGQSGRLQSLLGGAAVDASLLHHPLGKYLLRSDNPTTRYSSNAPFVNEDGLWALWLRKDWGLDCEEAIARDTLLAWAAESDRGPQFVQAMAQPAAEGVRTKLEEYLKQKLGLLGQICWRQWESGRGLDLLAFGVLCEAMVQVDDKRVANVWRNQQFKNRFGVHEESLVLDKVEKELAETAAMALRLLAAERPGNTEARRKLADAAIALADKMVDSDIRPALIKSRRLPTTWQLRLDQLGAALSKGASTPTKDAIKFANDCRLDLEQHDFFRRSEVDRKVHRAEMAVRLLVWLSTRQGKTFSGIGTPHADAETLAHWYATEGGYVDWARRAARGSAEDALGKGIAKVLERVDALRTEMDQTFARALSEWHRSTRPDDHIIPIDRALSRIAVPFLKDGTLPNAEPRRLLVLLLDGMAWAQAIQLLRSMQELPHTPWAPLAWHAGPHRIGVSPYPPVMANLPTITEVSRSAFFAGKPIPNGTKLDTSLDPQRFAENKQLHPFCEAQVAPRLMLRNESHTADGAATEAALTMIKDDKRGIVGIVINAIDASLKADSQQVTEWRVDTIKSLHGFLDAAQEAGRYVLLASDHGHVPADRLETLSSPPEAGARYRRWPGPADPVQSDELAFSGIGVYARKEMQGAVLLTTDSKRYGGAAHAGEHGGATLAEVVAPCILLGWDEPGMETRPADLRTAPLFVPDWWHFMLPASTPAGKGMGSKAPAQPKRTSSSSQLKLGLGEAQRSEPVPPPATEPAEEHPALRALVDCEMLKARQSKKADRIKTATAVVFLLCRDGTVSAEVFAKHLNEPLYRVEGAVSKLTEVLNVDGYEVLRFNRQSRQVILDKAKLEQQFEVTL